MSEDFGPDFVTLIDDDGNEIVLEFIAALEHNGATYSAFFPTEEEGEEDEEGNEEEYGIVILKAVTENGEEFLVPVEDEDEENAVYDLFMEQILEDEGE